MKAGSRAGQKRKQGRGNGFLIVAVDRGDAPDPSLEHRVGATQSRARGPKRAGRRGEGLQLDALAYVAEGQKGDYLTHLGQFPPMPEQPKRPKEQPLSSLEAQPARAMKTDDRVVEHEVKRTGVRAPKPRLQPWPSWGRAKKGYASAYKPQLEALRAAKKPAWEVEVLIEKFGEGIHEDERLTMPLLGAGKAELVGGATRAVELRRLDRDPPAIELLARGAEEKAEQELQLRLAYDDGSEEMLTFFVVPRGTPSVERQVLPLTTPAPLPWPLGQEGRG